MTRNEARPGVFGIIVGQGLFPEGLKDAATAITRSSEGVATVSSEDPGSLYDQLSRVVREHTAEKVIVFADLFGSSCTQAGVQLKRDRPDIEVICGVNLPMLVRFLQYRTRLSFPELVRLMHRTGREEVRPGTD